MVLTIGQMRSSVIFLVNNPTTAATATREAVTTGGGNDVYSNSIVTRGRLRKRSGNKGLDFGLIAGNDSYELICRFQSSLQSLLKTNGKVVVDSQNYTIASWEKVDQINHVYKFDLNIQIGS